MKKNKKKGFSLLELLIVVAIILIIATIAIPSLLRSRQSTNESACIGDLRTVNTGEVTYASSNSQQFGTLTEVVTAGLLDSRFSPIPTNLHGYAYSEGFQITDPISAAVVGDVTPGSYSVGTTIVGTSARYDYCTGADAVVRWYTIAPATSQGPLYPVQ